AHLAELREDERPVARGHNLLEHLAEACELARAAGERACLAQVVRRVVADLLERRDERQDQATPLDAVRGLDSSHRLLHRCLVERGLLARERADDLYLLLGRQVPYDPRVALHAAQDEWPDDSPEALRDVVAPVAFDGDSDLAPEAFERSKEPRIQVLRDRPQLGQPVLDRRAGECDAETGAEAEVGHPGEPGKPPLLIGAERAAEIPGDGDAVRAEPPAQPGNYARELPLGDDVDGQPRLRPPRRLPERHRDRLVRGEGSPARSEEPPRLLELLRIDRHPLAAEAHERRLEAGERDELARGEHLARERRLPAERHDL